MNHIGVWAKSQIVGWRMDAKMYRDQFCGSDKAKPVCLAGLAETDNSAITTIAWFTFDRDQAWKARIEAKPFLVDTNIFVTMNSGAFAINVDL
jgi:hypothetical protein